MVALEHTLIMLLLLISLLKARPRLPAWLRWAAAAAVLFALVVPTAHIALPWAWLAAMFIPLLLWQAALRLANSGWPDSLRSLVIWLLIVAGVAVLISVTAAASPAGAVLFGLLLASTVWETAASGTRGSFLGQVSVLTLAFLLAETDFLVEAPGRQVMALLGGAGLGALFGSLAVPLALRVSPGLRRDWIGLAQAYLAYAAALVLDVSPVAAAVLSVIVFVAYGANRRVWSNGQLSLRPLDSPAIFILATAALGFFGWQIHVPLTPLLLLEIVLGLAVAGAAFWAGYQIKSPLFAQGSSFFKILGRAALLLVPAFLLWPRDALLNPAPLAAALGAAALTTLAAYYGLIPLLGLYRWMDEVQETAAGPGSAAPARSIAGLVRPAPLSIPPETPASALPALFAARGAGCALVTDPSGNLAGIITEADLFFRQERLPQGGRSYPALFKTPVSPEQMPEVYAGMLAARTAADLMTAPVIAVPEAASLNRAILLMYQHDLKILPVVRETPEGGQVPVGILTRADIIRHLAEGN